MIKFLNIIDSKIERKHLEEVIDAFEKEEKTYSDNGVEIRNEIEQRDLSQVPWIIDRVSYSWLLQDTAKIDSDAYTVVYMFHPDNWKGPTAWINGWHMGKYNNYQVQLIRAWSGNLNINYLTLMMESMHSWDTPILDKLGVNLSEWLGVRDYDIDVLHGMYNQGTLLSDEESIRMFGEVYERWDYSLLIKKIAPLLNKVFNPMPKDKLTQLDIRKLNALWGVDRDEEAEKHWEGKTLEVLLNARIKDEVKELNQLL